MSKAGDEKSRNMYALYVSGYSLSEIARAYGCTRQSVFSLFKTRGLKLREKKTLDFRIFNGCKYTIGNHGYLKKTDGKRSLMHRDVWEFHNGEIPEGFDIHHIDGDKLNNSIENLECLKKSEHTRLYSPHNNQHTKGRKRR